MPFRRKNWKSLEWCDRNIKPKDFSDAEIIEALANVHPYSTSLIGLLDEACKRRLEGTAEVAQKELDHPDPCVATSAAVLLREVGSRSDVQALLRRAEDNPYDQCLLAALLEAVVTLDSSFAAAAIEMANRKRDEDFFDGDYVVAAVITRLSRVLPDDYAGLQDLLIKWAMRNGLSIEQRATVFERLAKIERTEEVEDFFIQWYIHDDGAEPRLTEVVNDALRQ